MYHKRCTDVGMRRLAKQQIKNKRLFHYESAEDRAVTDVVFVFEVHQPHRIKKSFFWEDKIFKRVSKEEFFGYYYDDEANREIFERASKKCYFPSNSILVETIDKYKHEKKAARVSFSISGIFWSNAKDTAETF